MAKFKGVGEEKSRGIPIHATKKRSGGYLLAQRGESGT